jgi:ComF family protein
MPESIFPGNPLHEKVLSALLVTECGICGNPIDSFGICESCNAALEFAEAETPVFEISADGVTVRCATCFVYDDDAVTNLLFALKEKGAGPVVDYASMRLKGALSLLSPAGKTVFVNVPRSTSGKMKYGFDQSELLAKRTARMCGVKYSKLIKRKGFSKEQKRLSAEQRQKNIAGKFRVRKPCSKTMPDSIVIFDDVMTTGSSIKECARLLHRKYPGVCLYAVVLTTR